MSLSKWKYYHNNIEICLLTVLKMNVSLYIVYTVHAKVVIPIDYKLIRNNLIKVVPFRFREALELYSYVVYTALC